MIIFFLAVFCAEYICSFVLKPRALYLRCSEFPCKERCSSESVNRIGRQT